MRDPPAHYMDICDLLNRLIQSFKIAENPCGYWIYS